MFKAGDDRGMTLLETLVAVGVMALIATVAFPRVERAVGGVTLREETTALVANLRLARAQAIRRAEPVTFSVARDGHGYGWSGSALREVPGGLSLAPANASVTFYPDGSATGGDFGVTGRAGRLPIHVDPVTGAVSMVTR